jgi:hypothetical protein
MKISPHLRALKALFAILCFCVVPSCYAGAASPGAFYSYLVGMQSTLTDYSQDFIDYAKSGQGSLEYEIPTDMNTVATSTQTDVDHIIDLYQIYELVSSEDKARIRPIIINSLRIAVQNIDNNIEGINNGLSHARRDVIVRSGSNLKRSLRELKDRILQFDRNLQE